MRIRFRRIHGVARTAAGCVLVAFWAGCAGRSARDTGSAADAACILADGEMPPQLRVGVPDSVRADHAPIARNRSERLVFAHLYETLLRIDCNGGLAEGVAESWSVARDGRTWTLQLRADAAFTEGSPATAAAVIDAWRSNRETAQAIDSLFTEVTVRSPRELRLVARDSASIPRLLAAPPFAIVRRLARGWPTGTGPYRVGASSAQQVRLLPRAATRPIIDIYTTGPDGRSALDDRFDAILSGDARTIEYARVLPGYTVTPLPWSRTYVLIGTPGDTIALVPPDVRAELAGAAVRGNVRPAEPPSWWTACTADTSARATGASATGARTTSTRAIAYAAGDDIARGLAERIAALAWPASRTPDWLRTFVRVGEAAPTVLPLNAQALSVAMQRDAGLAFIIAIPRSGDCGATEPAGLRRGAALVDARDHLIHRDSIGRVTVDGGGALRFGVVR